MIFKPNGILASKEVNSTDDILNYMGDHLEGCSHIEIVRGKVIVNFFNDPTGICIGDVY